MQLLIKMSKNRKKGNMTVQYFIILAVSGLLAFLLFQVIYSLTVRGVVTSYISADMNRVEKLESYFSDTCSKVSDIMPEFPPEGASPLYSDDFRWSTSLEQLRLLNEPKGAHFNLTWHGKNLRVDLTNCDLFGKVSIESESSPDKITGSITYKIYRRAYYNPKDHKKYIDVTFVEKNKK